MLEGLDDVPWGDLNHAYGPAYDVPGHLRALASVDADERDSAIYALYGSIYHQGTLYPATVPAIPFLVQLATSPAVHDREQVLRYLAHVGRSALWAVERGDDGSEHSRAFGGCADALANARAALVATLDDEDEVVRVAAAFAVANAGGGTDALLRLAERSGGAVRALLVYALAAGRDLPPRELSRFLNDDDEATCLAAGLGLHRIGEPAPRVEVETYKKLAALVEGVADEALKQPVELLSLDDDGAVIGLAEALGEMKDASPALALGERLLSARFPATGEWTPAQRAILEGVARSDGFWRFNGNAMLALTAAGVGDSRLWLLDTLGVERPTVVCLVSARGRAAAAAVCEEEGHPEWLDAAWLLFSGNTDALDELIPEDPAAFPERVMAGAQRVAEVLLSEAFAAGHEVDQFRFYLSHTLGDLASLCDAQGWLVHIIERDLMARVYKLKSQTRSRLGIDYAAQLNGEQKDVAFAENGPLLVLAGAGSGKTRALTYRVARMIDTGVPAEGIMLLTFTNRAAKEMLARVEELCGVVARRVLGGTFHHVGNTILRRYASSIGYEDNFTILDRDDAREVMGAAVIDAGVQVGAGRFPRADVLIDIASHAINTQTPVNDVLAERAPRFFHQADDVAAVCRAYIERKASMNLMDFDDLLMNWKVLLEECGEIADVLAANTHAILVDEYQDTNLLQAQLVDLMAAKNRNITVVGDDAQCIYGFRGAEVENMLGFKDRYEDARILPLTVNYRSTPEILSLANATLARAERGFDKRLQAVRPSGPTPAVIPCRDVTMQAELVAQRILELRDEGVSFNDMAVLYRAHSHAMEIQVELVRQGIPFVVRSGLKFFEQAHIKDVLAHLKLIYNPHDELSFRRAVKLQEGVGNASADTLWKALADQREGRGVPSLFNDDDASLLPSLEELGGRRGKAGVRAFLELVTDLSTQTMKQQLGEMIRLLLERFYGDYLDANFPNGSERKDDIEQLADYAGGFDDLEAFLTELSLVQDFTVEDAVASDDDEERVTLSSVHQAKGLEWSRVFMVWLSEGRFPSELALRDPGGAEEERRLFYVAVTRAKDEINLTYPQVHRGRDTAQQLLRRSRFIEELPEPELLPPEIARYDGETDGVYEVWQVEEEPLDLDAMRELEASGGQIALPERAEVDEEDDA